MLGSSAQQSGWAADRAGLERAASSLGGYRPHPSRDLQAVAGVLGDECLAATSQIGRTLIVVAVDGFGHADAVRWWKPDRLVALTSTFPSTSTTAWLSALSGQGVGKHGVVGTSYRVGDAVYNVVTDTWCGPGAQGEPVVLPVTTVFDHLRRQGLRSVACVGGLIQYPGPWRTALLRGAVLRIPELETPSEPGAITDSAIVAVDDVLAERGPPPALVWTFVDLDSYIHRHGWDDNVSSAAASIDGAASRWRAAGHLVVAFGDHGLVPIDPDPVLSRGWDHIVTRHCQLPAGGAGRVRWCYPSLGHELASCRELGELLEGCALVLSRDDLVQHGFLPRTSVVETRIGVVVALATAPSFPVPDPTMIFEHGSIAADEMFVPLACWGDLLSTGSGDQPAIRPPRRRYNC